MSVIFINMAIRMEYDDSPGVETEYKENSSKIQQIRSEKQISPDHFFKIHLYATELRDKRDLDSKFFPLIVATWEKKGDKRLEDIYSFDNNGVCLSHGYSRYEGERKLVDEKHDNSLRRLRENGELIKDMIGGYPIPFPMCFHTTVISLRENSLRGR
jgi:hypothetical protein